MTLDRSPEFLFKISYLYESIITNQAPGDPLVGVPDHVCPQSSIWSKFKYGPLGDIRDLDLVVSSQEILYVSIISQCKLCDIHDEAILTT